MNLSEHLEDLRKQHDLTQDQLAEKLTVTRQAISRWERGLAYPTVDNLKALAQLYQVSLDALLLDEPPEPAPSAVPEPTQPTPATAPESTQPATTHPPRGRLALTLAWVAAVLALLALPSAVPEPTQPTPATAPESTQPATTHPPRGRLALTLAWVAAVLALLALLVAGTALIKVTRLEQGTKCTTPLEELPTDFIGTDVSLPTFHLKPLK